MTPTTGPVPTGSVPTAPTAPIAAIILAGGTSRRMGSDKLDLTIDGQTLLIRAIDACAALAHPIVVAGPPRPMPSEHAEVTFVTEDPPLGGPTAGIAAALSQLPADIAEVLVLAGDLARPAQVVSLLAPPIPDDHDGLALADDEGFTQYLAARYHRPALDAAIASAGEVRDRGVWSTLKALRLALVAAPTSAVADLDTPEQASAAGAVTPPPAQADSPQNYTA